MGTARAAQEAKEQEEMQVQQRELERKRRELERKLKSLDARMTLLRSEVEADTEELEKIGSEEKRRNAAGAQSREEMARLRKADRHQG